MMADVCFRSRIPFPAEGSQAAKSGSSDNSFKVSILTFHHSLKDLLLLAYRVLNTVDLQYYLRM